MFYFPKKYFFLDLGVFVALILLLNLAVPGVALVTSLGIAFSAMLLFLFVQLLLSASNSDG
jgi:hypothetical protein